jgi:hypothetical protein
MSEAAVNQLMVRWILDDHSMVYQDELRSSLVEDLEIVAKDMVGHDQMSGFGH